jgi:hypothetical protein
VPGPWVTLPPPSIPGRRRQTPWKVCLMMEERLRFVARLLDGEASSARLLLVSGPGGSRSPLRVRPMEDGRKSSLSFRLAALPKPFGSWRLRIDWNNRRALVRETRSLNFGPDLKLLSPSFMFLDRLPAVGRYPAVPLCFANSASSSWSNGRTRKKRGPISALCNPDWTSLRAKTAWRFLLISSSRLRCRSRGRRIVGTLSKQHFRAARSQAVSPQPSCRRER